MSTYVPFRYSASCIDSIVSQRLTAGVTERQLLNGAASYRFADNLGRQFFHQGMAKPAS
jgi:hypothetical protein